MPSLRHEQSIPDGFLLVDEHDEVIDPSENADPEAFDEPTWYDFEAAASGRSAVRPRLVPSVRDEYAEVQLPYVAGDHKVVGKAEAAGLASGYFGARYDLPEVKAPEWPVGGTRVYDIVPGRSREGTIIRKGTGHGDSYVSRTTQLAPNDAYLEQCERFDDALFMASRSSVISLSDEDAEADGTLAHPRWLRSAASVEKERRQVETLYARLRKGRQPWMHRRTYKWFMDIQRRDALRKRQRQAIIGLLRKLGRDPKSPAVVDWVTANGYDAALAMLAAAAKKQGVLA